MADVRIPRAMGLILDDLWQPHRESREEAILKLEGQVRLQQARHEEWMRRAQEMRRRIMEEDAG